MNNFKTSEIKISTDSAGYMSADHKHQGMLFETVEFASRKEAREYAVEVLNEKKEMDGCESYEEQERRLEWEASWA